MSKHRSQPFYPHTSHYFLRKTFHQLKRTGTLKVDVRFIPWLPPSKDRSRALSGPAVLDFSLSKDGVTQTLAKDLELQFRRLPKGASPGILDWAELTSSLKTRFKSNRKLKLKLKPREASKAASSSQTYEMVVDGSSSDGGKSPENDKTIMVESNTAGKDVTKSKEFADLMDTVTTTNDLINKEEEMKGAANINKEEANDKDKDKEVDKEEDEEDEGAEEEDRHHRLSCGIIEGFNLSQICSLDNGDTDTQASVWADFARKQVSFMSRLMCGQLYCHILTV